MVTAVIGLVALVLLAGMYALAIAAAVVLGATAWVSWRADARSDLRKRERVAGLLYGPYRSPFGWHRDASHTRITDAA